MDEDQGLPNIADKAVIVIDNVPCCSKQTEEFQKPNISWSKKDTQQLENGDPPERFQV